MALRYYKNLDGLRGIAAMMVIVFHYFTFPISSGIDHINFFRSISEFGQHGVSLFFVLSGFVITRILFETRSNENYFRNFYIRRTLRIFPLYYGSLLVLYYLFPFLFSSSIVDFNEQLVFFLYLQNIAPYFDIPQSGLGHYWSLAVEEHFYILWPLLIFIFSEKKFLILFLTSLTLIFALKFIMLSNGLSINKFTFTRIDQIIMGAYLAYLERKGKLRNKKNFIYLAMFGLFVGTIVYYTQDYFYFTKEISKYFLLGIFFTSLIGFLLSIDEDHSLNKFLKGKILQFLGKISYGLYVWHIFVILILQKTYFSNIWIVDLSLTILGTILVSFVSFKYLEQPFIRLKDKFTQQGRQKIKVATSDK